MAEELHKKTDFLLTKRKSRLYYWVAYKLYVYLLNTPMVLLCLRQNGQTHEIVSKEKVHYART